MSTSIAVTRVLFDGSPAPLLYGCTDWLGGVLLQIVGNGAVHDVSVISGTSAKSLVGMAC
jgi:hypothetical protein